MLIKMEKMIKKIGNKILEILIKLIKGLANLTIKLIKLIIKLIIKLLKMLIKLITIIINTINKKVAYYFNSMNSKIQVLLIYALLISLIPNIITFKNFVETTDLFKTKTIIKYVEIEKIIEVEEETQEIFFETEIENLIYQEGLKVGLTKDQAIIALAISKHETGKWTSKLYKNNNNVGGIYNSKEKKFHSYESKEKGVQAFVKLLKKGYFDKGYDTIEKIQKKYCPIGAKNDPNNINQYWTSGVNRYYNQYISK